MSLFHKILFLLFLASRAAADPSPLMLDGCEALIFTLAPPTDTQARFLKTEWPYHRPKNMLIFDQENPLDISALPLGKRHIWILDAQGKLRIAREYAIGHNSPAANQEGRNVIKHRDLVAKTSEYPVGFNPETYKPDLEPARYGGELRITQDANGQFNIELNSKSGYTPSVGKYGSVIRDDGRDLSSNRYLEAMRNYLIELSKKSRTPISAEHFRLVSFENVP